MSSKPTQYIDGLGLRHARPKLNPNADLTKIKLSPEEFFLLSRVDGKATYGQLCAMSGMPEAKAAETLARLKARKIILGENDPVPKVETPRVHAPEVALPPPKSQQPTRGAAAAPAADSDANTSPKAPERTILEVLDDHSAVDPMLLAQGPVLDELTKMRILRTHRRLAEWTPYQLLGVPIGSDKRALKRGYFNASKEFHPDRYFGKDLGPFRQLLVDIFNQTKKGFESLMAMDDKRRAEFDALVSKRSNAAASARRAR